MVMSASYDTSVRCWDCRSRSAAPVQARAGAQRTPGERGSGSCWERGRRCAQVLAEGSDSVSSVAASGHQIFTASVDGRLRCYDLRAGRLSTDTVGVALTHLSLSHDGSAARPAAAE